MAMTEMAVRQYRIRKFNRTDQRETDPFVIPLQVSGVTSGDRIAAAELMAQAVQNLDRDGGNAQELAYGIIHSTQPVQDFGRPRGERVRIIENPDDTKKNFFERAYPDLFPYGLGGLEADRRTGLVSTRWEVKTTNRVTIRQIHTSIASTQHVVKSS